MIKPVSLVKNTEVLNRILVEIEKTDRRQFVMEDNESLKPTVGRILSIGNENMVPLDAAGGLIFKAGDRILFNYFMGFPVNDGEKQCLILDQEYVLAKEI